MENPRLTFATPTLIAGDRSLTNVMAHELAHSWSGNLVTNATWSDFWLNEGFTSYIENRLVEEIYGVEAARMAALLSQRELRETIGNPKTVKARTVMYRDTAGEDSDDYEAAIAYDKGAAFLLVLETHFGRPAFDAFLRGYFEQNKFQSMTTPRFLEILKRDLFKGDLAAWKKLKVDEWVTGPGLPANLVVPQSKRFELTKAAALAFAKDGSLTGVKKDWVTAEWLDFLANLPKAMTPARMKALDDAFGLTRAGNAEILSAWLLHAVNNTYEPALPAAEDFLTRMGRRKFLRPLYQALYDNEKTRARGAALYKKARPGYHPIATATHRRDLQAVDRGERDGRRRDRGTGRARGAAAGAPPAAGARSGRGADPRRGRRREPSGRAPAAGQVRAAAGRVGHSRPRDRGARRR